MVYYCFNNKLYGEYGIYGKYMGMLRIFVGNTQGNQGNMDSHSSEPLLPTHWIAIRIVVFLLLHGTSGCLVVLVVTAT